VLLIDEARRGHHATPVKGEVISSTFDEPAQNVQVSEMIIERPRGL
jgi:transcription termination factor Rho